MGKKLTKAEIEEIEEYHKYCPKSKSSNIISCPKKIIKKKNDLKWQNDYFKKIANKSKKKNKTKVKNDKSKKKEKTKMKKGKNKKEEENKK